MKIKFILIFLIALSCVINLQASDAAEKDSEAPKEKRTILKVSKVLEDAEKHLGKKVVVVGMFMGIDGKCRRVTSVVAGTWMIQDEEGACIFARGMVPEGFSPRQRIGLGIEVAVPGIIKKFKGTYYLQSTLGEKIVQKNKEETIKVLKEKARKEAMKEKVYITGDLLLNYAMLLDSKVIVKGLYFSEDSNCELPKPPGGEDVWALEDLGENCIFVVGPAVTTAGVEASPGSLITIKARIHEYDMGEYTGVYLEVLKEEEKKKPSE